jgi:hypothetical protein
MNIKQYDEEDTPERDAKIKEVLPKQTIISTVLEPLIEKLLFKPLAECVRQELEVYRAYPKKKPDEPLKEMVDTFDPTNNESCYMGKGFKGNDELIDIELVHYRQAIGTIPHFIWGNCTLLEIWGGDHFEEHKDMVLGAFEYGMKIRDDCPEIKFYTNPLFKNQRSKTFRLSDKQRKEKEYMDELMAHALVFGVKTPAQARRDMKKRR